MWLLKRPLLRLMDHQSGRRWFAAVTCRSWKSVVPARVLRNLRVAQSQTRRLPSPATYTLLVSLSTRRPVKDMLIICSALWAKSRLCFLPPRTEDILRRRGLYRFLAVAEHNRHAGVCRDHLKGVDELCRRPSARHSQAMSLLPRSWIVATSRKVISVPSSTMK